jgi:hypothetical protein
VDSQGRHPGFCRHIGATGRCCQHVRLSRQRAILCRASHNNPRSLSPPGVERAAPANSMLLPGPMPTPRYALAFSRADSVALVYRVAASCRGMASSSSSGQPRATRIGRSGAYRDDRSQPVSREAGGNRGSHSRTITTMMPDLRTYLWLVSTLGARHSAVKRWLLATWHMPSRRRRVPVDAATSSVPGTLQIAYLRKVSTSPEELMREKRARMCLYHPRQCAAVCGL